MSLERAYRRLLACYPWEHRRRYEEEMLGVLLDDAGPRRRRPPARDVLDLLHGALRARTRYAATSLTGQPWRDAFAVLGLLAPLVLFAYAARPVLLDVGGPMVAGGDVFRDLIDWHSWPRVVAWAAVLLVAATGRRRIGAVVAWAAAGLEAARAVAEYIGYLSVFDSWPAALAVVAAVAFTVTTPRTAVPLLGRRRLALLAIAALLGASLSMVGFLTMGGLPIQTSWIFTQGVTGTEALVIGTSVALGVLAVAGLPAAPRRRVLALLVPVAATLLLTRRGFADWALVARPFNGGIPVGLGPVQWLALALTPPLALAVAVAAVHRRERTLRLLALGRDADRRSPAELDHAG